MDERKIKVFGKDDHSLKTLGELLSNETSRKIISCLNGNQMYINQISKACGIQMNLVIHHIKKLEEVGLVTITKKPIVRKGVDHKFYKMIPNVFVNTTQTKEEMKKNGFFKKFFKEGIKFAAIGFVAFSAFIFKIKFDKPLEGTIIDSNSYTQSSQGTSFSDLVFFPMFIIIIGLIVLLIFERKKRKK